MSVLVANAPGGIINSTSPSADIAPPPALPMVFVIAVPSFVPTGVLEGTDSGVPPTPFLRSENVVKANSTISIKLYFFIKSFLNSCLLKWSYYKFYTLTRYLGHINYLELPVIFECQ